MTDRELLELAGKACGWSLMAVHPDGRMIWWDNVTPGRPFVWNPLADDGDALRLAVKLRINVEHCRTMAGAFVEVHCYPSGRGDCAGVEMLGLDDSAATRRAIVRAAAELGKAKQ